ncbi:DUF2334 domain-containing protein [Allokutzneria sp. A3M-2-11 16]|uniref:DUF2334 domain-containing protein n=1 Tax=Allokutzneria sp. A3M-2-11 16 TaxID=2962043 RepID=UPI0020B90256|nr:DUF2334 domain-containing protein [Allokutzneria sp. A3M-2-11 16]MCP3799226.1 DUF2334 domain-containing protein [Allokutzneria sp. A3M-2-11 16]
MATRLLVSLSGIDRGSLEHCASVADELDRLRVPLSLLTTPLPAAEQSTVDWIRFRRSAGDAVVLNGFARGPVLVPQQRRARRKPSLPAHEAGLRLIASVASFEARGLVTDCFAVFDETVSLGTMTALRRHGFAVCADANGVHDLKTGAHWRGRVRRVGQRGIRRAELVRIDVNAADLAHHPYRWALFDAVDDALRDDAVPGTYAEVRVPSPRRASAHGPRFSPR